MPTALVTGPTAGIGLAFATELARRGHDLVLVSRDAQRLDAIAADLSTSFGVRAEALPADLSEPEQVQRVADYLAEHEIDVLVNNAGFGIRSRFTHSAPEDEQRLLDVLVTAVLRLSHAAVPGMVERGRGTIVNVSSVASWIAGGTYSAAKAWVTVFSEGLHDELLGTGVHVTVACPGFVRTEFHDRAGMRMTGVPGWLWLTPDDVVRQALKDAERNKPLSVAGGRYRVFSQILRSSPRWLARRVGSQRSKARARQ